MGEEIKLCEVLVGKRPLESPRRRWENEIKMDLGEVVCEGVE
jgi:hypothetical protein